jgi:ankyrin repeat protein
MNAHPALIDLVRERQGPRFQNFTVLKKAAEDPRALADVLAGGVDPESSSHDGSTLLHRPDLSLPAVQLLLAAGADPDARWYDRHGRTPLFFATTPGVPTALYRAGAELDHRDCQGMTPLLFNVEFGCETMIEELVALGADYRLWDESGLGVDDYASLHPKAMELQLLAIFRRVRASERRAALLAQLPPCDQDKVLRHF